MSTNAAEIKASLMSRIAGQTENAALDVESDGGKFRAYVASLERGDSVQTAALTVGTSAVALKVGASNLTNRRGLMVQNKGTVSIYLGGASVTTANGIELSISSTIWFAISESATLYAISGTAGQNVMVLEMG